MPEINRGYYARVKGIDNFIQKFLKVIFVIDVTLLILINYFRKQEITAK